MKATEDILLELQSMNSPLADMPRNMPYEVPEGYFDSLPIAVLDHDNDNIRLKHDLPYTVPDNYFEELPSIILKNITQEPAKPRRMILYTQWMAAAILLLLVTIGGYNFLNNSNQAGFDNRLAQLDESTLNEYIENNISDFDMESIQNTYASNQNVETLINDINEDDIVNYLNDAGWQQEILYN
ncbi:MAG: hypothetical protein H6551_05520 [Chitinophagales bacterium]|nr:hypothetical protein [Chitinophagaceae bacterium]MCB9064589.1 hypothetical protein [Chitinophagales bacterium]